jgi:hypothetical protein
VENQCEFALWHSRRLTTASSSAQADYVGDC